MKLKVLLILMFAAVTFTSYAQDGGIRGKVVSRNGRVALSNVQVKIESLGLTAMTDKDGNMPQMKEALLADAVGSVAGALTGTSTVTTFVESASGVEAGGRTGLTALTTAVMFLACIFIAPIAAIIPAAATSSALIYVGLLMLGGLKKIDFDDIYQSLPVAIMLISMPISGSIGHGIGLGLISYSVLKLCTGKGKEVSVLTYVISVIFLVKFFLIA